MPQETLNQELKMNQKKMKKVKRTKSYYIIIR